MHLDLSSWLSRISDPSLLSPVTPNIKLSRETHIQYCYKIEQLISFDGTSHLYRKYIRFIKEPDAIKASVPKLLSCLGSAFGPKGQERFRSFDRFSAYNKEGDSPQMLLNSHLTKNFRNFSKWVRFRLTNAQKNNLDHQRTYMQQSCIWNVLPLSINIEGASQN